MELQSVGRSTRAVSWHQMHWKTTAAEFGIRAPVLRGRACPTTTTSATRQVRRALLRRNEFERFGYTDSCPGCAMPELAVSRRLIIPNKAAPAWKQSCRQPPKTRCDSVSPSMPRLFDSLVRWNLSARDIALRAKGGNLLQCSEATVKQVAGTAADRSCPPRCSIVTNFTSDSEALLGTVGGRDDGRSN